MRKLKRALLILAVGLSIGAASIAATDRYLDLQLFTQVLNLVEQYYVEKVDTKKLIYGGIKGMLKELDPHTNFLPPTIYQEFQSETSGEFGGLGVEITLHNGILTVISPIEDTPAWKAGVKAGDKIVAINGQSTKGMSLVEAAQEMRGKKGSKIILSIIREDLEAPLDITVVRGVVKLRSVKYTDLNDGYAYVRLTGFMEKTSRELEKAIKKHEKNSKEGTKGLILDLRRNPGGLLDQALQVSDLFLEEGVIVSTMGRDNRKKEVNYAKKPNSRTEFPMIILIDEFSASASEIVAGALQDHGRALIMGQKSFGKGSVQSVVPLGDGSGLKLTVARYYTPNGRSIQAEGILPDISVGNFSRKELEKARVSRKVRREKDIDGHLLSEAEKKALKEANKVTLDFWWAQDAGEEKKKFSKKDQVLKNDFQVLQAYNYLRAWKVMNQLEKPKTLTE